MLLLLLAVLADTTTPRFIATAPAETLAVHVVGVGRPVVLIPGLFGAAFEFRKIVPELTAEGHQTITIELLGTGASGRPKKADYSLTAQAQRVAAVLDTLGIQGAIVLAHSVGGSVAMRLAVERPDLVGGLVSVEGGPAEAATSPGIRSAMGWMTLLKLFGGKGIVRGKVVKQMHQSSVDTTWITPEVVHEYTEGALADFGGTLDAIKGMARSREPWLLATRLPEIRCPVVLVLGTGPHKFGPSEAEVALLRDSVPTFVVDSVPGAGHYVFEEQPDAVVAAIGRVDLAWMVGVLAR
jgi:2-hydroxy-6-oxonona-2,4-dienedioate hydrolase